MFEDEAVADGNPSRVYQDEIIPGAAARGHFTPPRYREMRKLAIGYGAYGQSAASIFYKQGRFMEDFEDEYDFEGEFNRYFPTYQAMNDRELRGYFSWRTKVRRGMIEPVSLSFVFLYIYELLNQIGVKSPEEGFQTLKHFWAAYREIDSKIDRYLDLWLKDYIVYYDLDRSLLADVSTVHFDHAVSVLLNYPSHGPDAVFGALNSLSAYNLENSVFYKQHPDEVKAVVYAVFANLSEYYGEKRKNGICEELFGKMHSSSYHMFRSAIFCNSIIRKDYTYEVNDICRYRCRGGKWSFERLVGYKGKAKEIGLLLKSIDSLLRKEFQFKSALKVESVLDIYRDIILKEIAKYRETQRKNAAARIEIDLSRLQGIRETALETQRKLIVEEPKEAEVPEPAIPENSAGLSDAEYRFLACLLYGKPYGELLKSNGLMLSVVVDSINEKLFDEFGDTVIACDGERPELIEDYVEELKGIIRE